MLAGREVSIRQYYGAHRSGLLLVVMLMILTMTCAPARASSKNEAESVMIKVLSVGSVGNIEKRTVTSGVEQIGNCDVTIQVTAYETGSLEFVANVITSKNRYPNRITFDRVERGRTYIYNLLAFVEGTTPHVAIQGIEFKNEMITAMQQNGFSPSRLAEIAVSFMSLVFFAVAIIMGIGFFGKKFAKSNMWFTYRTMITAGILFSIYLLCVFVSLFSEFQAPLSRNIIWLQGVIVFVLFPLTVIEGLSALRMRSRLPEEARSGLFSVLVVLVVIDLVALATFLSAVTGQVARNSDVQVWFTAGARPRDSRAGKCGPPQ
jgi:hypothetical protein